MTAIHEDFERDLVMTAMRAQCPSLLCTAAATIAG
jgi:hypothetical protein